MPLFPVFELDEKQRLVTSIPLKPQSQRYHNMLDFGIGSYFLSNSFWTDRRCSSEKRLVELR